MSLKQALLSRALRWCAQRFGRSGHAGLASSLFAAAGVAPSYEHARVLWLESRHGEARDILHRLLDDQPDHPDGHNLLGAVLIEFGKLDEAARHFQRSLAIRPGRAAPLNNLGAVHLARNALDDAEACYRKAIESDPDYVEALTNLGSLCNVRGRYQEAERHCRLAISRVPSYAGAHCNLGNALLGQGLAGEAVAAYREALRLKPGLVEALINLSLVLEDSGYLAGVIDYYEKKLALQPGNTLCHLRVAQALQALNRWDEARERLQQVIGRQPGASDAMILLGHNLAHAADVAGAVEQYRRALAIVPDAAAHSSLIFNLLYLEGESGASLCAAYRSWAERHAAIDRLPRRTAGPVAGRRRLRIGYVSRDFFRHSVAYFLEPILRHHDRTRVDVTCYSTLMRPDAVTERLRGLADRWRDISLLSVEAAAAQVAEDGIDILVDLSGHTAGNRLSLFARKPAPVQVSYLGHPATTGIEAIDYRLGDAHTDPPGACEDHYVERLWRLPGCFLAYQPDSDAPPVAAPPAGRPPVFGSFNNAAKINGTVVAAWAGILAAIPDSRLLLKGFAFDTALGRQRLLNAFAGHGVGAERLELFPWRASAAHHLQLYSEIDIALDPFPYNGTTTTCEALWMGAPVVSLVGDRHSGRVGASLLATVGLDELIAEDVDAYVRIAVALAKDRRKLDAWRTDLRRRMQTSPLLDHADFVSRLEHAYEQMWVEQSLAIDPPRRQRPKAG